MFQMSKEGTKATTFKITTKRRMTKDWVTSEREVELMVVPFKELKINKGKEESTLLC